MTKTEIINEINRLEKMNEAIKNTEPHTRNEQFYLSINKHEIIRLKEMLDKQN